MKDEVDIDINRDFPYLVKNNECMRTIGARVVNELFISHLFSLSLTLHGGTESLTYPFGSPNHLVDSKPIPTNYIKDKNGKVIGSEYKIGSTKIDYGDSLGKGDESPDLKAESCISIINQQLQKMLQKNLEKFTNMK